MPRHPRCSRATRWQRRRPLDRYRSGSLDCRWSCTGRARLPVLPSPARWVARLRRPAGWARQPGPGKRRRQRRGSTEFRATSHSPKERLPAPLHGSESGRNRGRLRSRGQLRSVGSLTMSASIEHRAIWPAAAWPGRAGAVPGGVSTRRGQLSDDTHPVDQRHASWTVSTRQGVVAPSTSGLDQLRPRSSQEPRGNRNRSDLIHLSASASTAAGPSHPRQTDPAPKVAMRAGGLPPDLCHAPDVRALPAPSDLGRGPSEAAHPAAIWGRGPLGIGFANGLGAVIHSARGCLMSLSFRSRQTSKPGRIPSCWSIPRSSRFARWS